jgi:hypothetical protein
MNELINKALEIAEEYPVFPCDVKKRPICAGGFKAATQDADEIERLFSAPNAALIGMPTGAISGIDVVDIDVRDGKAGEEWRRKHADKLGATRIARTQSGGYHYYYRHRDGIRNRAGINGCTDVRGDGGYVIVPPSDGYSWVNDEELAQYPDFLVDAVSNTNNGDNRTTVLDAFGSITDGREKYMADMVYAAINTYNRENGQLPTVEWMLENVYPTYASKVVSRTGDLEQEDRGQTMFVKKVQSTLRKAYNDGLPKTPQEPHTAPQSASSASDGLRRRITLKSLSELRKTPPPTFQVAPYLIDKSFAVLFGAPASFKSFLALDWALSIAHGSDWNGRPVIQGTVVYLALEGQTGLATRSEAWHRDMTADDENVQFYAVTSPISMVEDNGGDVELLVQAIEDGLGGVLPTLIVVDTLARSFVGKDENSATDMGLFVRNVDLLREHFDCTVLVVHHSGKAQNGMRGSSALRGAVDSEFELVRETGTQAVCLKVRKQKDTEEASDLWLEAREVQWLEGIIGTDRSSLVLDARDGAPEKPMTLTSDQRLALQCLDRLIEAGTYWEERHDGSAGIPENVWRQAVAEHLPEKADPSNFNKFRKRLAAKGVINEINGLVCPNGKAAT